MDPALEDTRVLPEELRAGVPRDLLEGRVRVHDPSLRIGDDDRLRCLVDGRGQASPIRLGVVDRGDVLGDDHRPAHPAVFVAQRGNEQLEVARPAVPMRVADRDGHERLAGHHLGEPARDPGRVVGPEDRGRVTDDFVLAPPEDVLCGRAPRADQAVPVDRDHGQGTGAEDRGGGLDGCDALAFSAGKEVIPGRQDAPQRDRRDDDEADALDRADELAGAPRQEGAQEDVGEQDPGDAGDRVPARDQGGRHLPAPAGRSQSCPDLRFAVRHATPESAVPLRTGAYGAARSRSRGPICPSGPDLRATGSRIARGPVAGAPRNTGAWGWRPPGATCRGRRRRTSPPARPRAGPRGCGTASRRRS